MTSSFLEDGWPDFNKQQDEFKDEVKKAENRIARYNKEMMDAHGEQVDTKGVLSARFVLHTLWGMYKANKQRGDDIAVGSSDQVKAAKIRLDLYAEELCAAADASRVDREGLWEAKNVIASAWLDSRRKK
jgi:hypothetical protein